MDHDLDGKEKLKRMRKLLGNEEINKPDSDKGTKDVATPAPTPDAQTVTPVDQPKSVQEDDPKKTPPPEPAKAPASTGKPTSRGGRKTASGTMPQAEQAPPASDLDVDQPGLYTRSAAPLEPAPPTPMPPAVPETKTLELPLEKNELIDTLPKTAWGVKITMKDFVFIRDHDKYRLLFKDQRTFREKFVEWMRKLEVSVTPELTAARDVTLTVRKPTPDTAQNGQKDAVEGSEKGKSENL
jgi:hypothetical protein